MPGIFFILGAQIVRTTFFKPGIIDSKSADCFFLGWLWGHDIFFFHFHFDKLRSHEP